MAIFAGNHPQRAINSTPTKHDGRAVLFAVAELLVLVSCSSKTLTWQ